MKLAKHRVTHSLIIFLLFVSISSPLFALRVGDQRRPSVSLHHYLGEATLLYLAVVVACIGWVNAEEDELLLAGVHHAVRPVGRDVGYGARLYGEGLEFSTPSLQEQVALPPQPT